jgi:glycine/serine hydroxymethyltransferase
MEKTPREYYDEIFQLAERHHKWFSQSIPLVASENLPSPAVREAIASDFGSRYAEKVSINRYLGLVGRARGSTLDAPILIRLN